MSFSDDDEDIVPQSVSSYHFEDDDKVPVSFAVLPLRWSDTERVGGSAADVYLRGLSDDGLQTIYKPVKGWRFDILNFNLEIFVLTKDNIWIKLLKPRKSYEGLVRTILITLQSLHFLRRNPEASGRSLWEHVYKAFRSYDVKPSQKDLVDHIDLINESIKRDNYLARSKFLCAFLEKPVKKRLPDEDNSRDEAFNFIVEEGVVEDADEDDVDDDDDDYFESVCAICDNGGTLLCCEGSCLRSFHPTKEDGEDSMCDTLGLTKKDLKEIQHFFCKNCEHKMHQCFICRKLGSSDKSAGAEVFRCVSATCVYFYHPACVARWLYKGNRTEAEALEKRIFAGESFTCPLHKCCVCKQGEVKNDTKLQFAVCRRCPKSYHRKCLPREIAFSDNIEEDIHTRAWDGLLHDRVLIYCLDHEIDDYLCTPVRDHVKFPFTEEKKNMAKEMRKVSESLLGRNEMRSKAKDLALERKMKAILSRDSISAPKIAASNKKQGFISSGSGTVKKVVVSDPSRKSLLLPKQTHKVKEAQEGSKNKASLGMKLFNYMQDTETQKPRSSVPADCKHNKVVSVVSKESDYSDDFRLDTDSERRILALMKEAGTSITMEDIVKKHQTLSTHTSSIKHIVDKTITLGKVEGSVEAVKTALAKLVDGNNIEDAKAVCEPEVLKQIFKWKDKLKVYLAPFLYGPRYTSYGRHFTKVDKLQKIVDRLHWYSEEGDMIVDFCCGANDFSWLMKRKLEETGKKCLYKNYDLIQAKNDFNFEKRDWMTVRKEELLPGSRLIMGLNPPFGVKSALANKFINKALEFQPKLLVLIVPVETERLDKKKSPYVLVWEDKHFLSGKSFYLPGSVDDGDKQMDDWNVVSPPLYLWSRSDWAPKHLEIAQKHDHLRNKSRKSEVGTDDHVALAVPMEELVKLEVAADDMNGDRSMLADENDVPMEIDNPEVADEVLVPAKSEAQVAKVCGDHLPREKKRKKSRRKPKNPNVRTKEDPGEMEKGTSDFRSSLGSSRDGNDDVPNMYPLPPSPNAMTQRPSLELVEASHGGARNRSSIRGEDDVRENPLNLFHHEPFGASYGGAMRELPDNVGRRYGYMHEPPYVREGPNEMRDYRSYSEIGRGFNNDNDARDQIRRYGQYPADSRDNVNRYGVSMEPITVLDPFGRLVSSAAASSSSSYRMNNAQAMMQQRPPHFDELSYQRSSFLPDPPPQLEGNPFVDFRGPPPPMLQPPRPPGDYTDFAPGHHSYSFGRSGGWLND